MVTLSSSRWPDGGRLRVVVVLDRPVLVELVALTLNHGVCEVRTAISVGQVAAALAEWHPHLLIVDMALNGSGVMQHLRTRASARQSVVVIGLVARGDLASKLTAFDAGVDDILAVPFAPEELLARALALLRRSRSAPMVLIPAITVGKLEIDLVNRIVRAGDLELGLTAFELGLLYLLAANPGRVLTRAEILETLLGADHQAERKVVDQQVRNLRARLHEGGQPRFIATVPGRGYRFLPAGQTD